ncbi:LuxR C-terminal-related transcriptional regulator [Bacillus sp. FJAT-45350]|uniref:LuxR C-terminal-related transcriptional regulator n=1 Tax=Bacillus sp. FJAT-45350 TaxID=2011014 RepID=UPI000BB823CD|nr:LuxR C-terminal-related transcriptional regulator [Bacillus sp. FJAT-45350]
MSKSLSFLQSIQDDYAKLTNLTLVITDVEGNEVTKVSNFTPLSQIHHNNWGTKENYHAFLKSLQSLKVPTIIDNRTGLKIIISPIRINANTSYYIFAGYILETLTRQLVKDYIVTHHSDVSDLITAIDDYQEISEDEKQEKITQISNLATVVETYLQSQYDKQIDQDSKVFTKKSLDNIRVAIATKSSFLEELYSNHLNFNFLGLAMERSDGYFYIDSIYGKNTEQLKGHSFVIGEGFLGHTIATLQLQFWKHAYNDPRVNFFHRHCLYPKSLFCQPIFEEERLIGILFGGSTEEVIGNEDALEPIKMYSSLLSVLITTQTLKENLHNHLLELSTFNEVFRVMTTVKDIKRVLYILVDISINIMRGPFACIVYKPSMNNSKIDIVSRGLSSAEINDYGYDVAVRSFSEKFNDVNVKQPIQGKTKWGIDVVEFPLYYNGFMYGILCVGLNPKYELEKYKAFLSTLAVAGGISIHLCREQYGIDTDDFIINLLTEVMDKNGDKYRLSMKIRDHVEAFTTFLNDGDFKLIRKISGIALYERNVLEKYLSDKQLITIFNGYKNVLENKSTENKDSEILVLIYTFVTQGERVEVVKDLSIIRKELKEKFISYLNQESIVETVISLDERQLITSSKPDLTDGNKILKNELHLSSREVEVLNLILKGKNNREIANKLFISEHTVKNHITRIFQKLEVNDRAQAIAMVYQLGYTPPN